MRTRRDTLAMLGGAATGFLPNAASAQQGDRKARVGIFVSGGANLVTGDGYRVFVEELRKRGFDEGRNLTLDVRPTEQDFRGFLAGAADMIRLNTEVIVAGGAEISLQGTLAASSTVPIVMVAINYDPIA